MSITQCQVSNNLSSPGLSDEFAIETKDVCVSYRSYKERPSTLKESLIKFAKTRKLSSYSTIEALSDVNLQIPKGKVFAIIGSNGAGKSTLLRVLSGVLPPTSGSVQINGELDSLIQLGAGFDPDLNAIENIYLYGSLHCRSKEESQERVPGILKFAELEEFAHTPIKYYSSGMYARLGFSVAIDRDPDILLLDEVLAVGDERFQKKCDELFYNYIKQGKTIVIVSHGLSMIETLADEVALLSRGTIEFIGDPKTAIEAYRSQNYQTRLQHEE